MLSQKDAQVVTLGFCLFITILQYLNFLTYSIE